MKATKSNSLKLMFTEKCPHCGNGNVFEKPKHFFDIIPKMKVNCESCGYHYEREPGFYQGAMFVSYGLGLIEGVIIFFVLKLSFPILDETVIVSVIIAAIVLLSMKNFRISRMMWLYLLPK